MTKLTINGREICPELVKFVEIMQLQIDLNIYKDKGGIRGWKLKNDSMQIYELGEENRDLVNTVHQITSPIGGESVNIPSPTLIAKEAADVGCRAMFIADSTGGLDELGYTLKLED